MDFRPGRRRTLAAVLSGLAIGAGRAMAADCPPPAPAVHDIKAIGYYSDAAKSVIDPVRFKANLALTQPLNDFSKTVAGLSDAYLGRKDAAAGACALAWLDAWAQGSALLGEMQRVNNDQPDYLRQWVHAGAAIAYLKVQPAASAAQRGRIEAWLKAVAASSLAYWDDPKKSRNNHYSWTGVGVMGTAIATGDAQLLDRSRAIYRHGVDEIRDDGALPLEMARGERAFHYHNYALDPLVLMAEMARRRGEDWYAYRDMRIDRLAARVAEGYADPSWFAARAGKPQVAESARPTGETGWVEFYRLRAPRPERFAALHAAGPYDDPRAGGDLTLMADRGLFDAK
jgi:poly(beta-D-mannuronate) lyase